MTIFRYFSNNDLEEKIKDWQAKHSDHLTVGLLGESYEKRPIYVLTITNMETGSDDEKPAIWIDANIHATEITGTTAAMAIAETLLENYDQDSQIKWLLDNAVYYIVPRLNPDGAALAMASTPKYIRSGVRAYPYPEKDEGLHVEDIDHDGRILQMRIVDPAGDWKVSAENPRLMIKRSPDEIEGTFYRIFQEGILDEYDGYLIKNARSLEGLDFNRNFPFEWQPESDQHGAGPYPGSESEIRAAIDFITSHTNINLALTYHTFSRVILRPYSIKPDDEMDTSDLWTYQKIGNLGTDFTGYRNVSTFHDFKYHPKEVTTGAFDDWMYDHYGVFCFTIELWDLPSEAGVDNRKFAEWFRNHPIDDDIKILNWVAEHGGEAAYINWYAFDHPQLGPVELGGWNTMYTWRNPPQQFLENEIQKNTPFALIIGRLLPHLSITNIKITKLAEKTYYLRLFLENTGYLPTYTSMQGKNRKAMRPVRVELELPEGSGLIEGKRITEIGHLDGRSSMHRMTAFGATSPTNNRSKAEWVVKINEMSIIKLHVTSERAGTIHAEIQIPGEKDD